MVNVIAACIGVTAASVAVLQFFLALEESPRAAAEATWVLKLSRWCAQTSRRWHDRIFWGARLQDDEATSAPTEAGHRRWRPSRRLEEAMPGPALSNGTAVPHPAAAGPPGQEGVEPGHRNGTGATRDDRLTAPSAAPNRFFANGRAHWVWGTRPDFYAESDGSDRLDLEPSADHEPRGWARCKDSTRSGDLVLVYRSTPRKDLRYVVEVVSDAYPLDHHVASSGGYGCDYRVLHKIDPPISLAQLREDPVTSSWQAVRVNFRQCQLVPAEVWERLATIIAEHDPRAGGVLRRAARAPVRRAPEMERRLESRLFQEPQRLSRIGLDVEAVARRVRHPHGGVLDMLFRDKRNGDFVVVALKPGRGAPATVTQLLEDIATVPDLYETPQSVRGLLIAAELDRRAERILRGAGNLDFARLDDVGLSGHAA